MKKNLANIFLANIAYLLLVAANNFLVPKFTSVETYAAIKEYTLYLTTYAGVLTFGYIHGMYLEYGGQNIKSVDPAKVGSNLFSFFLFILPISIAISVCGILTENMVLAVLGAGIIATNMVSYYQLFYQATGDFKSYSVALNASRVLVLLVNVLLIFVFRTDYALFYVILLPISSVVTAVYLTYQLNKRIPILKHLRFSIIQVKSATRGGFVLMLGNFVTSCFTSIDRWFVNYLMDTVSFAMYSFAVSMENMVSTLMTPITVSMYNYLCKSPEVDEVKRIKDCTMIYGFVIIAAAFPAKWLMEHLMQEYLASLSVMFFLFAAQAISTIIRGIYVNKYNAEGKQKKYLKQMIAMLILAAVLDGLFYMIWHSISALAAATLITNLIWLIVCEAENPMLRYGWKETVSLCLLLVVYLLLGLFAEALCGFVIYCASGLLIGLTLMRDQFLYVIRSFLSTIRTKLG